MELLGIIETWLSGIPFGSLHYLNKPVLKSIRYFFKSSIQDSMRENNTLEAESVAHSSSVLPEDENKLTNANVTSTESTTSENRLLDDADSQDDDSDNTLEPQTQNGSIIIQNPEYLRISWTTENKKYRLNLYNSSDHFARKVQSRREASSGRNFTAFSTLASH